MSDSAKKLTTLDDLVPNDNFEGLKSLIVESPKAFAAEDLFEIRLGETRIGPIWNQDLKAYVAQDLNFPISCFVSQFATDEWVPILQHPFFQRRKPQLVARNDLNIENEEFYLLHDGKKSGPHTAQEIETRLTQGSILVSDQISSDGGVSWGRVYEIEEFDRRNITPSGELPFMPEWQVFNNSFDEVEKNLTDLSQNSKAMETDAIASLAYLENLQSGKATQSNTSFPNSETEAGKVPRVVIAAVVAIAAGLSFAAWLASRPVTPLTSKSNTPDNASSVPTKRNVRKAATNIPSNRLGQDVKRNETPLAERVINKVNRNPSARKNSFRNSRAFRESVVEPVERDEYDNDFAYDNDRPLEQDPIGSKISKESFAPDDEYQKELLDEGYDAQPDYAQDRFQQDNEAGERDFAKIYDAEEGAGGSVGETDSYDQVNENGYEAY